MDQLRDKSFPLLIVWQLPLVALSATKSKESILRMRKHI
jgi:hypothetical protein